MNLLGGNRSGNGNNGNDADNGDNLLGVHKVNFLSVRWASGVLPLNRHRLQTCDRADSQVMNRKRVIGVAMCSASLVATSILGAAAGNAAPKPTPTPTQTATPAPKPFSVPANVQSAVDRLMADQIAVRELAVAEQERQDEAVAMQVTAIAANSVAEARQTDLEAFARNTYMTGSPTTTQLILNSNEAKISDVLQGVEYVKSISADKGLETALALNEALKVQAAYATVLSNSYVASAETLLARQRVKVDGEALRAAAEAAGPEVVAAVTAIGSLDDTGCPTAAPADALVGIPADANVNAICHEAIAQAVTPQAKAAIQWAFTRLGSPYACEGVGRENTFQFDCSSLVSRAYEEGAGIVTSVNNWSPTTHTMLPETHPNFRPTTAKNMKAGDLVLYYTCPEGEVCTYNHVVMYLGVIDGVPLQLHTNSCGAVANITPFWGAKDSERGALLGIRTVVPTDPNWVPPVVIG